MKQPLYDIKLANSLIEHFPMMIWNQNESNFERISDFLVKSATTLIEDEKRVARKKLTRKPPLWHVRAQIERKKTSSPKLNAKSSFLFLCWNLPKNGHADTNRRHRWCGDNDNRYKLQRRRVDDLGTFSDGKAKR
eukprot:UN10168